MLALVTTHRIAVVGGTGPQGKGLGYRFARHGHQVVLGSRDAAKAEAVAAEIDARLPGGGAAGSTVGAGTNAQVVRDADVVVLAVPYAGHDDLVASLAAELAGRIVVSCVNPLGFDKLGAYGLDVERSAAEAAAAIVPTARIVGAFHHVSAVSLWSDEHYLDHEDVLVCGDDAEAKSAVMTLAETVTGRPGVDAGALRLARQLEPLTAVLISINKRYRTRSGVRISGI